MRAMPGLVAVATAIVATACSSSAGSSSSTTHGAVGGGSGTASIPGAAALRHSLPAEIRSKGRLIMATDATIGAPFASFGSDNKTIEGLNVDMGRALARVLGMKLEVANTPFGTFIPGLQAKRYDLSISVMLDTREREKVVDFVDYIKDGSSFLVRADDNRNDLTLGQVCGMKVAAITGSVEEQDIAGQSRKCTAAGRPAIKSSVFAENAQGMLALTSRRVDVWAGDSDQNAWLMQQNNGKVKQSGSPFNAAIEGIALPKNRPLVHPILRALQLLMDSGEYSQILGRYGVRDGALAKATLNDAQY